ncbi:prephenate dehydratase [Chloroflexota bacterium]
MVKVSIQGYQGSFHDIVARRKFGGDLELIERSAFFEVFEDVKTAVADFGVVAIENSIGGSILENFDLLLKYNLKIVAEMYLRIVHNLIVLPGVTMRHVKEVYTHPIAVMQCLNFLQAHSEMKIIRTDDTAGSVKMIKERDLINAAAIASKLAAEIYDMEILASSIETAKENYTRFLVISGEARYDEKADKTSMVIQTEHRPGSLFKSLKCFADEGINLSKIESRPIIGKTWNYYFYLDFEAAYNAPETKRALEALGQVTSIVKILGSYERGGIIEM